MMKRKTAQLLKRLASSTGDDLGEVFTQLADIIAMNCIRDFPPEDSGLRSEKLTKAELDEVKETLVEYIECYGMKSEAASAFWCLSKFHDDGLKEYFIERLSHYYQQAGAILSVMGQIEICLSNLDEDILSDDSYSSFDYGKNMSDTRAYLKRQGKITG